MMAAIEDQLAQIRNDWVIKRIQMSRTISEWKAKHCDQAIPPGVKHRVLETWDRTDYLTGNKIPNGVTVEMEHIISVIRGGIAAHCESNLRPTINASHKVKSAREKTEDAKTNRIIKRSYGINAPKQKIRSQGFRRAPKERKGPIEKLKNLPPPPLMRGNDDAD